MGPFAGQILSDLGADTIKVEPLDGDVGRQAQPGAEAGMGAMYVNNNRNKRVIALDLKSTEGKKVMDRLLAWSEVFLHNMRMDAIDRLGLTFAHAVQVNPQLIYCSVLGFGQGGRYRGRPAFDDVIQAACGLAGLSRQFGDEPRFIPTIIADKVGALYAVYGVLAALLSRARGNQSAINVEAPMFEALVSFLLNEHLADATFSAGQDAIGYGRIFDVNRRPHRTKDGWIVCLTIGAPLYRRWAKLMGEEHWLTDPRFKDDISRGNNGAVISERMARWCLDHTTAEAMEILGKAKIPAAPVLKPQQTLDDPHIRAMGFFQPVDYPGMPRPAPLAKVPVWLSETPGSIRRRPPTVGEHTDRIMSELGFAAP